MAAKIQENPKDFAAKLERVDPVMSQRRQSGFPNFKQAHRLAMLDTAVKNRDSLPGTLNRKNKSSINWRYNKFKETGRMPIGAGGIATTDEIKEKMLAESNKENLARIGFNVPDNYPENILEVYKTNRGKAIAAAEYTILINLPVLLGKAFELAHGVVSTKHTRDGEELVYEIPPNVDMLKYLLDRGLGKPGLREGDSPTSGGPTVQIYMPDNGRNPSSINRPQVKLIEQAKTSEVEEYEEEIIDADFTVKNEEAQ